MNGMEYQKLRRLLSVLLLGSYCVACDGAEVPSDWKTECIGHYQISVPGDVEVALTTMRKLYKPNDTPDPHRFSDGTIAAHSNFNGMRITAEVSPTEFEKFKQFEISANKKSREKLLQEAESTDIESLRKSALEQAAQSKALPFKSENIFGWEFREGMELYQFYDGHIYFYRESAKRDLTPEAISTLKSNADLFDRTIAQNGFNSFLNAFHPRKLFESPKSTGICLPYAFISGHDNEGRNIGVTMRLKEHPDVEIFFRDQSAYKPSTGPDRNAKEQIAFFWKWMNRETMKEVRLGLPSYHSAKLDGREGVYTFAEILRPDDSIDFGYVAYVKGDPDAAIDTPNLMLYVIRTASLAKGKPVSKHELKDIAQKIAASVRRHH